ncbi:MAG: AAA family ATPase [Lachnospiraceae bacterium]|nr:AAA family ATPase [Lachnospiraceae bacterium]
MGIKREIYNKILDWKNETNGKKALLVEGARRIGKSTVVEEFAHREYKSYILIDFNKAKKKVKDAFDDLDSLDVFFQTLSLEYNSRLYPRESLIIFDEIQKYPKAMILRAIS